MSALFESSVVFFLVKVLVSAVLIAAISSLARYFPKWAALLTALPLVTFLSLIWIYLENKDLALLETYTRDVLIWVVPTLVFLVAALALFHVRLPFVYTLVLSTVALGVGVYLFNRWVL